MLRTKLLLRTGSGLGICVLLSACSPEASQHLRSSPNRNSASVRVVVDVTDALPPGAADRIGTSRMRHSGSIGCLSVSPDGQLIATGSPYSPSIRVWSAATGQVRLSTDGEDCFVAFSPDGNTLATSGKDGDLNVRLWDVSSKQLRREFNMRGSVDTRRQPAHGIGRTAFSPDGKLLAVETWHEDHRGKPVYPRFNTICFLDASSGEQLRSFAAPDDNGRGQRAFRFSPDGSTLAMIGGKDSTVYLVDVQTATIQKILGKVADDLAYSADGRRLAISHFNSVRVVDSRTSETVGEYKDFPGFQGPTKNIGPVALSRDGRRLAVGGEYDSSSLQAWNVDARTLEWRIPWRHGLRTSAIEFTPDSEEIITAENQMVRVRSATTGDEVIFKDVPRRELSCAKFSPDGKMIAVCGRDEGIFLYDVDSLRVVRKLDASDNVRRVAFSPDGSMLAAAGLELSIWNSSSGKKLAAFPAGVNPESGRPAAFSSAAFLRDDRIVAGTWAGVLSVWNTATGKLEKSIEQPINIDNHRDPVFDVTPLPDDRRVATTPNYTGTIRIWDLETSAVVDEFVGRDGGTDTFRPLAISPDGGLLAYEVDDWNAKSAQTHGVAIQELANANAA